MTDDERELAGMFEGLRFPPAQILEEGTAVFNCIAWAADDRTKWWQPLSPGDYWPVGCPDDITIEALVSVYVSIGYQTCPNGDPEGSVEKIALMIRDGFFSHAMKQEPSGTWTSKLGAGHSIRHGLCDLIGDTYGELHTFMSRPLGIIPTND